MLPAEPALATVPPGHCFAVGIVDFFLRLATEAATSFRGAAGVLRLCVRNLGLVARTPCWHSGRCWLLRVGLFALRAPPERGDGWVLRMDHTIQLGPWKCLVIVSSPGATINQALATIRTKDVSHWCRETFGVTIAAQRRSAFIATKMG